MILSDHQAHALFLVLGDTLVVSGNRHFKLNDEQRLTLFNEILAQQIRVPRELSDPAPGEPREASR